MSSVEKPITPLPLQVSQATVPTPGPTAAVTTTVTTTRNEGEVPRRKQTANITLGGMLIAILSIIFLPKSHETLPEPVPVIPVQPSEKMELPKDVKPIPVPVVPITPPTATPEPQNTKPEVRSSVKSEEQPFGFRFADLRYTSEAKPLIQLVSQRASSAEPSRLELPTSPVPVYSLVRVRIIGTSPIEDVLVLTAAGGEIMFADVMASSNSGEYGFTGPPGSYSIRVKVAGQSAMMGRIAIGTGPAPDPNPDPAKVTAISLDPASSTLQLGQTLKVTARLIGANGAEVTGKTVTWNSIHIQTVQLNSSGGGNVCNVTGVGVGQALVEASYGSVRGFASIKVDTQPQPGPDPVIPPGKYGFAKMAYDEAKKIADPAMRALNVAMADNFESLASQIAATSGTMTAQMAVDAVSAKNKATLNTPEKLAAWQPFRTAWSVKAQELNKAGTLRNLDTDYAIAFQETADGLRLLK